MILKTLQKLVDKFLSQS